MGMMAGSSKQRIKKNSNLRREPWRLISGPTVFLSMFMEGFYPTVAGNEKMVMFGDSRLLGFHGFTLTSPIYYPTIIIIIENPSSSLNF